MLAPLSWLKEYVDITLKPNDLGLKLTEVGLGCEKIHQTNNDIIFELEITPNRPDWLSIIGVAREIAAIERKKIRYPNLKTDLKSKKTAKLISLKIHPNFNCSERMTGIIINNITVKESPQWLKDRLISIGQRPINNVVDITNFVMYELGNPIHSFDFNKIENHEMWVKQAKGGEKFESVDEISYKLPKGAIIYEDSKKIFDLAGIKGGRNSGTYNDTKTVFILVAVDDPLLIRKASQALGLRSDASAIFERAVNKDGTIDALKRTTDLILEYAGGEIASDLIDLKEQDFKPWKLKLRLDRLEFVLGMRIPEKQVMDILEKLSLNPILNQKGNLVECTIPTYRNDLKIEEDLIEEVARLYGYNNFPKTLPDGQIPTAEIPHFKNYRIFDKTKELIRAAGFSEIYTYSLISKNDLLQDATNNQNIVYINNPVSSDFEYLRPTLVYNLKKAFIQNMPNFKKISLFELGKIYHGISLAKAKEPYQLAGITNELSYREVKGVLERLFESLNISDPKYNIEPVQNPINAIVFFLNFSDVLASKQQEKIFKPLPKFPPVFEDISFILDPLIKTGDVISLIKKQSTLITRLELLDLYQDTRTFHIVYQDPNKNLTNEEVTKIREKIIKMAEEKFGARVK